jgi:hypothetical protein
MQFKNPEILYFLFLLIIPILVHLFQLRRFKKQEFTNVKLLKELEVQTRKSATIKKWLLLVTRLLLLTALIFAFAQPFFKAKDFDKKNNELILVIDNSFSMQAKGKSGELLKRTIQDILENTPEDQQLSVLTNDENFYDTTIRNIQNELQNLNFRFETQLQIAKDFAIHGFEFHPLFHHYDSSLFPFSFSDYFVSIFNSKQLTWRFTVIVIRFYDCFQCFHQIRC